LGVDKKDDEFITSLLEKTCMYEKQWLPKSMQNLAVIMKEEFSNFALGMDVADEEAEAIAGRSLQELFERSGVDPARIDVLACMSTMMTGMQSTLTHQFGFRENLEVMTLGGMGCAAGITGMYRSPRSCSYALPASLALGHLSIV
jgi:predicted naringenin-chalcone synthase